MKDISSAVMESAQRVQVGFDPEALGRRSRDHFENFLSWIDFEPIEKLLLFGCREIIEDAPFPKFNMRSGWRIGQGV
jgi:hypothetical protein